MKKRINVAELLKDCPKGMSLGCTMFDNVKFIRIEKSDRPICIRTGETYHYLTKFGTWTFDENAKCVIFPRYETTWEGFVPPCEFKDGDVIISVHNDIHLLRTKDSSYCAFRERWDNKFDPSITTSVKVVRLATEEEKQILFDAIKANGYKWNEETKTLVKLFFEPKFKVGDRIRSVISLSYYTIIGIEDDQYVIKPDDPEKFPYHIHFSLEINYKLVPNKFDINTLIPFESKVLVRDKNTDEWRGHFFSHYDNNSDRPYICIGVEGINEYKQCIPYECNEHLLGKTKDCEDRYKLWLS